MGPLILGQIDRNKEEKESIERSRRKRSDDKRWAKG